MSGLLGLFYFDMYDFPKLILLTSPFMFFIGAVTLVLGDNLEKAKGFWDLAFQGTVFALHFGMVIFIWVYVGHENYNDLKSVFFYISPVLLFFGWFLNANITLRYFQLNLGKEWWLDITLEGDYVPNTGSIRDIHVGQKVLIAPSSSGGSLAHGGNTGSAILNPSPSYACSKSVASHLV
ncbi:MAG: hypothetical protein CMH56_06410 [Myxococcales bacterium]|nr:hypothetical protein [Myxococcales bacterium]|tara:strand:- start:152 stop:688 length:537 start_codon:yes stop_codon:yes gene_type:complete